jgi:hypothetical protein
MNPGLNIMYTGRAVGYTTASPADPVGWEQLGGIYYHHPFLY